MKTRYIILFALSFATLGLSGCASIMEEDPNSQETPWNQPADWEGQMPGMPGAR